MAHERISVRRIKSSLQVLGEELLIGLSVLLPVLFYLLLRGTLSHQTREFTLTLANLTKPVVYPPDRADLFRTIRRLLLLLF